MKAWVREVEPPVGLDVSGVCVFSNLVSNHSDFLRKKRSQREVLGKAVAQISCYRVFWYCAFIPSLANLEYEPQLSTNPNRGSCWGWRLVRWSYVPVARHPGQRPNFDWSSQSWCQLGFIISLVDCPYWLIGPNWLWLNVTEVDYEVADHWCVFEMLSELHVWLTWLLDYFQLRICKWKWWGLGFLQRQQFGFPQRQKRRFLQRQ